MAEDEGAPRPDLDDRAGGSQTIYSYDAMTKPLYEPVDNDMMDFIQFHDPDSEGETDLRGLPRMNGFANALDTHLDSQLDDFDSAPFNLSHSTVSPETDGDFSMASMVKEEPALAHFDAPSFFQPSNGHQNALKGEDMGPLLDTRASSLVDLASTSLDSGAHQDVKEAEKLLASLEFGKVYASDGSTALDLPPLPSDLASTVTNPLSDTFSHRIIVAHMPTRSRVETQIQCQLLLSPPPSQLLLHLPTDTMARPRFQLRQPLVPAPQILDLEVEVVAQNMPDQRIYMCDKCTKREAKRAFRKKSLDKNEQYHWSTERPRRLAIFNCKEVVALGAPKQCEIGGQLVEVKEVSVPLRLACYCRHHAAKPGYKVVFTARDHTGTILARTVTDSITITDDHKDLRPLTGVPATPARGSKSSVPPSPISMEESSEYTTDNLSSTSLKRRRDSNWNGGIRQNSASGHQLFTAGQRSNPGSRNSSFPKLEALSPGSTDNSLALQNLHSGINITSPPDSNLPNIQRIIPAQGSVAGGIEVTLLGSGFFNGLVAKFGDSKAMSTQCWSDSTIVTHLPPAPMPGPVVVSFDGVTRTTPQIFTYVDDTDSQLIELALQVVGLKMNGKLEDARNIAMRIVGSNDGGPTPTGGMANGMGNDLSQNHERIILRCLELSQVNIGKMPNLHLRNMQGQTMMHLASALGYYKVILSLLSQGARLDLQDINGMTPLHFAALHGHRKVLRKLLKCHADPFVRTISGLTVMDVAHNQVLSDLPVGISSGQYERHMRRTSSTSTFASSVSLSRMALTTAEVPGPVLVTPQDSEESSREVDDDYSDDASESDYDDGDLRMGDVRTALLRRRSSRKSLPTAQDSELSSDGATAVDDSTEQPARGRINNTAENISAYFSQLTETARQRLMPWDRPNWEEILNYVYRRPAAQRTASWQFSSTSSHGSAASDSDYTVLPQHNSSTSISARRAKERKTGPKVWQYIMSLSQAQEEEEEEEAPGSPATLGPGHSPPRYEEIFPDRAGRSPEPQLRPMDGEDVKLRTAGAEMAALRGAAPAAEASAAAAEPSAADEAADYEEQLIKTWTINQKQLQNDRRLFFFWIPVLVVAVGLVVIGMSGASTEVYNSFVMSGLGRWPKRASSDSRGAEASLGRPLPAPPQATGSAVALPRTGDAGAGRTAVAEHGCAARHDHMEFFPGAGECRHFPAAVVL